MLGFLPVSGNEASMSELDALIMRGVLKLYVDDLSGAIADLGIAVGTVAHRAAFDLSGTVPVSSERGPLPSRRLGRCPHLRSAGHLPGSRYRPSPRSSPGVRPCSPGARLPRPVVCRRGTCQRRGAAAERFPQVLAVANAAVAAVSLASARGYSVGVLVATEPVRSTGLLGVGGCPGIFNWRAMEADALIDLGRLDDAEAAMDDFERAIPQTGLASAAMALARCRGNLAVARGKAAHAEEQFAYAHSMETLVPTPFEHALLGLDDGRRLRSVENAPGAVAQLEKAHRVFSQLGADPYVQACATELAALEVAAAPESPAKLLLSRAELAVARLVASGLTNREVASQLYVSVKTVEYHLRNSYIKLDITSRRALTALLR